MLKLCLHNAYEHKRLKRLGRSTKAEIKLANNGIYGMNIAHKM